MTNINHLNFVEVSDIISGAITLPEEPAVYVWFRKLQIDPSTRASFLTSIEATLRVDNWPFPLEGDGRIKPYGATFTLIPLTHNFSASKRGLAQIISADARQRQEFARLILEASLLQPPLYVGKANSLATRIEQHLTYQTGFSQKIQTSRISLSELVIVYLLLSSFPDRSNELLEGLIGYLAMPHCADRIG